MLYTDSNGNDDVISATTTSSSFYVDPAPEAPQPSMPPISGTDSGGGAGGGTPQPPPQAQRTEEGVDDVMSEVVSSVADVTINGSICATNTSPPTPTPTPTVQSALDLLPSTPIDVQTPTPAELRAPAKTPPPTHHSHHQHHHPSVTPPPTMQHHQSRGGGGYHGGGITPSASYHDLPSRGVGGGGQLPLWATRASQPHHTAPTPPPTVVSAAPTHHPHHQHHPHSQINSTASTHAMAECQGCIAEQEVYHTCNSVEDHNDTTQSNHTVSPHGVVNNHSNHHNHTANAPTHNHVSHTSSNYATTTYKVYTTLAQPHLPRQPPLQAATQPQTPPRYSSTLPQQRSVHHHTHTPPTQHHQHQPQAQYSGGGDPGGYNTTVYAAPPQPQRGPCHVVHAAPLVHVERSPHADYVYQSSGVTEPVQLRTRRSGGNEQLLEYRRQSGTFVLAGAADPDAQWVPVRILEASEVATAPLPQPHQRGAEYVYDHHDNRRITMHKSAPPQNHEYVSSCSSNVTILQHTSPVQERVPAPPPADGSGGAGGAVMSHSGGEKTDYGSYHVQYDTPSNTHISPVVEHCEVTPSLNIKPVTYVLPRTRQPVAVNSENHNNHNADVTNINQTHHQQQDNIKTLVIGADDNVVPAKDTTGCETTTDGGASLPGDSTNVTKTRPTKPPSGGLPLTPVTSTSSTDGNGNDGDVIVISHCDTPLSPSSRDFAVITTTSTSSATHITAEVSTAAAAAASTPESPRKDQRRSLTGVESDLDTINKSTPLYGQPEWWGEDKQGGEGLADADLVASSPGAESAALEVSSITPSTTTSSSSGSLDGGVPPPTSAGVSVSDEVMRAQSSVHTPPERDTTASDGATSADGTAAASASKSQPLAFTVHLDMGTAASGKATNSSSSSDKPGVTSAAAAAAAAGAAGASPVAAPAPVEKPPTAFTIDVSDTADAAIMKQGLSAYMPKRLKDGMNKRAEKVKPSDKLEGSSKVSPKHTRRSSGQSEGNNSSRASSDNDDFMDSYLNRSASRKALKSRMDGGSPKKTASKYSPTKQPPTVATPSKSPKTTRKFLTQHHDTTQTTHRSTRTTHGTTASARTTVAQSHRYKHSISMQETSTTRHTEHHHAHHVTNGRTTTSSTSAAVASPSGGGGGGSSYMVEKYIQSIDTTHSDQYETPDEHLSDDLYNDSEEYHNNSENIPPHAGGAGELEYDIKSNEGSGSKCDSNVNSSMDSSLNIPDNVSESGTYTIESDVPSAQENDARSDIDVVFGVESSSGGTTAVESSEQLKEFTNKVRGLKETLENDFRTSDDGSTGADSPRDRQTKKLSRPTSDPKSASPSGARSRPPRRSRKSHSPDLPPGAATSEGKRPSTGRKLPVLPGSRTTPEVAPYRGGAAAVTMTKSPHYVPAERDGDDELTTARSIDTEVLLRDTDDVVRHLGASRTTTGRNDNIFLPVKGEDSDSDSYVGGGGVVSRHNGRSTSAKEFAVDQRKPPRPTASTQPRRTTGGVMRCKSTPSYGAIDLDASGEFESDVSNISTDHSPMNSPRLGRKHPAKPKSGIMTGTRPNRAFELRRNRLEHSDTEMTRMTTKARQPFTNNAKAQAERPKSAGVNKTDYRSSSEGRELRPAKDNRSSSVSNRQTRAYSQGRELLNRPASSRDSARTDISLGTEIVKKSRDNLRLHSSPSSLQSSSHKTGVRSAGVPLIKPGRTSGGSQRSTTDRRSPGGPLTVAGHKSQPSSRSNSPRESAAASSWRKRKEYDPMKAALADKNRKQQERRQARARSVGPGPIEDELSRPRYDGLSSVSSCDDPEYFGDESSVSGYSNHLVSRMSSNDPSHMTRSVDSDDSTHQAPDIPYDRQLSLTALNNKLTAYQHQSRKSAFHVPPVGELRRARSFKSLCHLESSSSDNYTSSTANFYTSATRPSRRTYSELAKASDPSYTALRQLSLKVKTTTDHILERLCEANSMASVTYNNHQDTDCTDYTDKDLRAVMHNLNTTHLHLKDIERSLFPPSQTISRSQTSDDEDYIARLGRIRSENQSFQPIDSGIASSSAGAAAAAGSLGSSAPRRQSSRSSGGLRLAAKHDDLSGDSYY